MVATGPTIDEIPHDLMGSSLINVEIQISRRRR